MRFDHFVDLALYDPMEGFYVRGGRAGRRGDFLTSVEVGPLFGAVLARALDAWWDQLGQPDPFTVVEAGAGVGTLARAVHAAAPACQAQLKYVAVERSATLRAEHDGLRVQSLAALPPDAFEGVILANELLDNLAFRVLERGPQGWLEVHVDLGTGTERLVEADSEAAAVADRLVVDAPIGSRIPLQEHASRWLREALNLLRRGRLVAFDYAVDTTSELAHRPVAEWLRTYRDQQRGLDPTEARGLQDITAEVALDQLQPAATVLRLQADFLADHGIETLVAEGRAIWAERAHIGDLAALRARSRIRESEALTDPSGLGGFRVLEWVV